VACPGVLAVANDRSAPESQRVAAAQALGTIDDPDARKTLQGGRQWIAGLAAVALLAGTRPGAGSGCGVSFDWASA